jgi:hypothetical protein
LQIFKKMKKIFNIFSFLFCFALLCCSTSATAQNPCDAHDRAILMELFTQTGGVISGCTPGNTTTWKNCNNWGTAAPLNQWYGIRTNSDGCVTGIDLDGGVDFGSPYFSGGGGNGLSGTIPSSIGGLSSLTFLSLSGNTGFTDAPIPTTLNDLHNLEILLMTNCNRNGIIPPMGNLSKLTWLCLDYNKLEGGGFDFNGVASLRYLYLNHNKLGNGIHGIPSGLTSLNNLVELKLQHNRLIGGISTTWNCHGLDVLLLDTNELTGGIPDNINSLWPNLTFLQLHHNGLTGGIPANLGQLHLMKYLALSYNPLGGPIPPLDMPIAQEIMLNNDELTGSFPTFTNYHLGNLPKLHIENNFLKGDIPSFADLPYLNEINVSNNKFIFGDMEGDAWLSVANKIYAPQAKIPIKNNNCNLSVHVGGTLGLEHFNWFQPSGGPTMVHGNNTYQATQAGVYHCESTHDILTALTLISEDIPVDCKNYCDCKKILGSFYQSQKDCNPIFGIKKLDCFIDIKWYINNTLYAAGNGLYEISPILSGVFNLISYEVTLSNGEKCKSGIFWEPEPCDCDCAQLAKTIYQSQQGCQYTFGIVDSTCIKAVWWYVDGVYVGVTAGPTPNAHQITIPLTNGSHVISYEINIQNGPYCKDSIDVIVKCPSCECADVQKTFNWSGSGCNYDFSVKQFDCITDIKWYIDGVLYAAGNGLFGINPALSNGGHSVQYVVKLSTGEECKHGVSVLVDCPCNCTTIKANFQQSNKGCDYTFGIKNMDSCIDAIKWIIYDTSGNNVYAGSTNEITTTLPNGSYEVVYYVVLANGEECKEGFKVYSDCPTCKCDQIAETFYQKNDGCNNIFGIKQFDCVKDIKWYINGTLYTAGNGLFEINPTLLNGWYKLCYVITLSDGTECRFCTEIKVDCCNCDAIEASFYQSNQGCDYTFGIRNMDNCIKEIEWSVIDENGNQNTNISSGLNLNEIVVPLTSGWNTVTYYVYLSTGEKCSSSTKVYAKCDTCTCADIKTNFYMDRPEECEFVFGIKPLSCIANIEWTLDGNPVLITGTMYEITLFLNQGTHLICYSVTLQNGEKCEGCFNVISNCNPFSSCTCADIEKGFYQKNDGCNYTFGVKSTLDCIMSIEWYIDGNLYIAGSGLLEINPVLSNGSHSVCYVVKIGFGPWTKPITCKHCVDVEVDCPCTCDDIEAGFYQSNRSCDYTFGVPELPCIRSIEWYVDGNLVGNTNEITVPLSNGTHDVHYTIVLSNGKTCIYCIKVESDCCIYPEANVSGHLISCWGDYAGVVILNCSSPYQITWMSTGTVLTSSDGTLVTVTGLKIGTYTYRISDGGSDYCEYTVTIGQDFCCCALEKKQADNQKQPFVLKQKENGSKTTTATEDKASLQVVPNPANEVMQLRFSASKVENRTVALYTTDGKRLIQKTLLSTDTSTEFDTSLLPSGVFIVQLSELGRVVHSAKVVVQH